MKYSLSKSSILLLAVCLGASPALFAHNHLEKTMPVDGSVLAMAPKTIELGFEEDGYLLSVDLMTTAGEVVSMGFAPPIKAASHFSIPLPPLAPGDYRVKWAVEGDDTHKLDGEFTFSVKPAK